MAKLKKFDIIEVFWVDIESQSGWVNMNNLKNVRPPLCKSIGYFQELIREKGKLSHITISHTVNDSGNEADYTTIPYGCIKRIVKVE